MEYDDILSFVLENMRKIVSPEEWLELDLALSKLELFTMLRVENSGELIMSRLAGYLNIPMSTATGIVDRLVKNGYVTRERSEADRRIVVIRLTDRGKEIVGRLKKTGAGYVERIMGVLTEEERNFLFTIFRKVADALTGAEEPASEGTEDRLTRIRIE